jgi:hypothetical protein
LPSSSGKIRPIAVAEPVVVGISETDAAGAQREPAHAPEAVDTDACHAQQSGGQQPALSWPGLLARMIAAAACS